MRLFTSSAPLRRGESFEFTSPGLKQGEELCAVPAHAAAFGRLPCAALPPELFLSSLATGALPVGATLNLDDKPILAVLARFYPPWPDDAHTLPALRLKALEDIPAGKIRLSPACGGPALAWVTVSDKGSVGLRDDASGPAIAEMMSGALPLRCHNGYMVPDEIHRLRSLVADLALTQGYDFIITSGGTGLTPRDITPEALAPLIEKRLSGLEQAMLGASLAVTPRGALSRPLCGSVGSSLLITLPGSTKAVRENLAAILPALGHGLEKLQGGTSDCGRH